MEPVGNIFPLEGSGQESGQKNAACKPGPAPNPVQESAPSPPSGDSSAACSLVICFAVEIRTTREGPWGPLREPTDATHVMVAPGRPATWPGACRSLPSSERVTMPTRHPAVPLRPPAMPARPPPEGSGTGFGRLARRDTHTSSGPTCISTSRSCAARVPYWRVATAHCPPVPYTW
jgi:hypothetical protein